MTPFRDVMAELESKAAEWGARAGAAYRAAFEAEGVRQIQTDGDAVVGGWTVENEMQRETQLLLAAASSTREWHSPLGWQCDRCEQYCGDIRDDLCNCCRHIYDEKSRP